MGTLMGTMTTKSKQQTNNLDGEKYLMRIESPKIIDCTHSQTTI
jgi:hypothetical protein